MIIAVIRQVEREKERKRERERENRDRYARKIRIHDCCIINEKENGRISNCGKIQKKEREREERMLKEEVDPIRHPTGHVLLASRNV